MSWCSAWRYRFIRALRRSLSSWPNARWLANRAPSLEGKGGMVGRDREIKNQRKGGKLGQNHTCKFPCMWLVRDNFFGFAWTSGPITKWGCSLQHEQISKAVDYSDWFSRPCAQKDGRVRCKCSSIGWIYMLQGLRRGVAQSGQRICFGYRGSIWFTANTQEVDHLESAPRNSLSLLFYTNTGLSILDE